MRHLEFGDMVFYAIVGLVVILLLWLRFMEQAVGLWPAWLVWGGWLAFLIGRFSAGRKHRREQSRRHEEAGEENFDDHHA